MNVAGFERRALGGEHALWVGRLPADLDARCRESFDALWALHPADYHEIQMHGRLVKTPRWQQAYGADYHYSGRVNRALPIDEALRPIHDWAKSIEGRLNGILLNWYDAEHEHSIGKHRDSTVNLVAGAPIVTITLGAARTFRLRPWRMPGMQDLVADHGAVFVMPFATNLAFTHEVPHFARDRGRRISVTLRAFENEKET